MSWVGLHGPGSVDSLSARVDIAFRDSVETLNGVAPASYEYDGDGLLDSVTVNGSIETLTHRTGDGLLSGTSVGGVTSALSYNNHGELWKLRYDWPGSGSFEQVLDRDSLGRIVKVTESGMTSHTYDYHYDPTGRLDSVAVDGAHWAGYTFDANGNRVALRGTTAGDTATGTYDAQDRLLRYGNRAYIYTAAGELAARVGGAADTLRTTYDVFGNLVGGHAANGDSVAYVVAGANLRAGRLINGYGRTSWLYGDRGFVAAELDSTGAVRNRYVYGAQGHVPDLLVQGATTYRLITDQLGSVRAVVNVANGTVVQRIDYDVWGVITTDTAPTFQSLGFVGGLEDRTTGLIRFGARDYEPNVGRWTAKDPADFAGGTNLYQYCLGRPEDIVDPEGSRPRGTEHERRRDEGKSPRYRHAYNCRQTEELVEWAREEANLPWLEAMAAGVDHHGGGGVFDFLYNEPGATFVVDGKVVTAAQFGNYLAGYTGEKLGQLGYTGVRAGGVLYALLKAISGQGGTWDDSDSVADIDAGARRADRERSNSGRSECGCP